MLRHGRLMVPGHPSWPHRPLGILPTRRRRRGSSPSLAPTSSSVNLLPGGEPSTRHSCANIYVSIDIFLGIVYQASLCCGIYPHTTTTTILLLLLYNNLLPPISWGVYLPTCSGVPIDTQCSVSIYQLGCQNPSTFLRPEIEKS